ncbi:hypothetical protein F5148DRAFT_1145967 [Russula earlei]|uniref:Uncharacterized protein n=1 Tax=Russula earlei TaxID=71964 RepID=A0ACC0ULR8_9AGAM|nr:hypothetical protein F5148DRAFT_1145967 [Russula earlei]
MSSPTGYWDDEELNAAVLTQLVAIDASQIASTSKPVLRKPSSNHAPSFLTVADSDDLFDITFDVGVEDLQRVDAAIESEYRRKAASPPNSPSVAFPTRPFSGRQTTLLGGVVSPKPSRRGTQQRKSPTRPIKRKTKTWDHTAFAKTGKRRKAGKGKGKENMDEEGDEGEDVEFEQFPAPFVQVGPPPPMKLQPDLLAAQRWIYPLNRPKRDYQFNISRHCLFDNTLVSLPTGLGKTFIAGVVMLNFYKWYPEGKLVFVAPTKPLVAQQIDACHKTCGIPGRDAIELTGNNPRTFRYKAWQEKRIFYMTPQTLENDLKTDNCDAREIVLLVVGTPTLQKYEAHKGAGEYAYAKVVRLLMAKNPYFRVLALTATPGRTPEAVQALVDALHISRIEIRDEQSLDIRSYINERKVEQHIIAMDEGIAKLRDLLAKVLGTYIRKCVGPGILRGNLDPINFHPYRANAAMEEIYRRPDSNQLQWAYPLLRKIGAMARAMGYLATQLEATPQMCFRSLTEDAEGGSSDKPSGLNKDPGFQALMDELRLQKSRGFAIHPKLEKLKTLVVHHFGQRLRDDAGDSNGEERSDENTRAMVFVTFREAVEEIVDFLNQESPLLRATKFIGQGLDRMGKRGLAQREQLDIINQFKDGIFNVLVATSVGEEGLDIGEVDLIVCYDAQKTPIRMLQRVGRTGRKRQGFVHVLLAEGREEMNWNKAREAYNDVQRSIVRGEQLELYDDVERLLPDHVKPECLEMVMEIEEYDRAVTEKSRENIAKEPSKKRKRTNDPTRDIPPGACTGFVSVAELLVKQKAKKRKKASKFDDTNGMDDDTDEEIEAGLFAPRRAASTSATSARLPKTKLKRAKTTADGGKKKQTTSKKAKAGAGGTELTLSQFSRQGVEDSDDKEIEKGLWGTQRTPPANPSPGSKCSPSVKILLSQNRSIVEICASATPSRSPSPSRKYRYSTPPLYSDDYTVPLFPSPSLPKSPSVSPPDAVTASQLHFSSAPSNGPPDQGNAPSTETVTEDDSLAWLLADSDDGGASAGAGSPAVRARSRTLGSQASDAIEIEDSETEPENGSPIVLSSSHTCNHDDVPPPAAMLPQAAPSSPMAPEPSLPIRAAGRGKKRSAAIAQVVDTSSSPLRRPSSSQKRLHRRDHHLPSSSSAARALALPSPKKKRRRRPKLKVRDAAAAARLNPWIDVEAGHSGDEVSGGPSSPPEDEDVSESDRRFVTDLPGTLPSPSSSYDQAAVYRQSLLSQAPMPARNNSGDNNGTRKASVPVFAAPPARRGARLGGPAVAAAATASRARGEPGPGPDPGLARRGRFAPLGSPAPVDEDEGEDYYMLGSFVVDDEAEISFLRSSSES